MKLNLLVAWLLLVTAALQTTAQVPVRLPCIGSELDCVCDSTLNNRSPSPAPSSTLLVSDGESVSTTASYVSSSVSLSPTLSSESVPEETPTERSTLTDETTPSDKTTTTDQMSTTPNTLIDQTTPSDETTTTDQTSTTQSGCCLNGAVSMLLVLIMACLALAHY